jgi:hypothetical protein
MALSTIERAFQLAGSGEVPDLPSLKRRLQADGCRAVDALLAPRDVRGHLQAICAATFNARAGPASAAAAGDER